MTALATPPRETAATPTPPPDLTFLDTPHPMFTQHKEAWEREERRYAGGDDVLEDLVQFDGESDATYQLRKASAVYTPLGAQHLARMVGLISGNRPLPQKGMSFGSMGEVRPRSETSLPFSRAEQAWYSVDSPGMDGTPWPVYFDALQERAGVTGHRWLLCEMPPNPRGDGTQPTEADEAAGFRPYAVEYSPLEVPYWHIRRGQLQCAIVRVASQDVKIVDGRLSGVGQQGYYLLVRKGFQGLGAAFAGGGWWLYDAEKRQLDAGTWERTDGVIPMLPVFGKISRGTTKRPAMSASLVMELGQIAVQVMNAASARFYDFWDACASRLFFLGATPEVMTAAKTQNDNRSVWIGVPPVASADGSGQERVVSIYDGSTGTVPAEVADKLMASLIEQAREIMLRDLTSTPDSSGASKQAGFSEATEPLLVQMATLREQAEASFMYFMAQRWGVAPDGYVDFPREFDLLSERDAVDKLIDTLARSTASSPTLTARLVARVADAEGLIENEADRKTIEAELKAGGETAQQVARLAVVKAATDAGAGLGAAAEVAGFTPDQVKALVNTNVLEQVVTP